MKRIAVTLGVVLVACGSDGRDTDSPNSPPGGTLRVYAIGPKKLAVGDTLDILGAGFVSPDRGKTSLRLTGRFVDDEGMDHPIERTISPTFHASSRLSWRLWPDVVFHPDGNRLGTFSGELAAVNQRDDGTTEVSKEIPVELEVLPSLVLRVLRPTDASCAAVVSTTTTGNTPLALAVEAVGFRPASEAEPLEFRWTLGLEHLDVEIEGPGAPGLGGDTDTPSVVTITHAITSGAASGLQDPTGCDRADRGSAVLDGLCEGLAEGQGYRLNHLGRPYAMTGLKTLRTRNFGDSPASVQAPILVELRDADGHVGQLAIALDIFPAITFEREATRDRIIRREPALAVAEAMNEGKWPKYVTLHDNGEQRKTIGYSVTTSPLAFPTPFFWGFPATRYLSEAFGINIREGRSSSWTYGDDVVDVAPGFCVTRYRQAEQVRRFARVIGHDRCGEARDAGDVYIDDWQWAREEAISAGGCPAPAREMKPPGPCEEGCRFQRRN